MTVANIRRAYPRYEALECGRGHCAAATPCTGKCSLKEAIPSLPVIDPDYLDAQLGKRDAASFGGLDHLPVEMIEPIPSVVRQGAALKTFFIVGIALALGFIVWASLP